MASTSEVIRVIKEKAMINAGEERAYRIYYAFNEGKEYFGADLVNANIRAHSFEEAWLKARDYILANARDWKNQPIDIYDPDDGGYEEYLNDNPDDSTLSGFVDEMMKLRQEDDTLWIQPADEACKMEWSSE